MQKDDLPDPLDPLIMHVNGALNLRSSVMREEGFHSCLRHAYLNGGGSSVLHLYLNATDVSSLKCLRYKNEILYILSSGSVIMGTTPPPPHFLLRLIFSSVYTVTTGTPFRSMSLMTSKFNSCDAL